MIRQNSTSHPTLRRRICLNRDWRFIRADVPGAEATSFDDSTWEPVGLPHCFDIPYFRTPEFYVGYGWYRKVFAVEPDWKSKRVFIEFGAAFQDAEVFVNAKSVGRHQGGYTGFCFDITHAVTPGPNVLAVRLNNLWNPQLIPRAGEHIFSGGLYRDACLVVTASLHIAHCGTFVTTPRVSADSAIVKITTEIQNDSPKSKICNLKSQISDPAGRPVAVVESSRSIAPGEAFVFDQTTDSIPKPLLWHPDHPHLYFVRTTVFDGDAPVDDCLSPLGFRWFEWTADRGFVLNGEHLYLRGANAHQDHAGWGIAVTQVGCERDVRLIKEAGFNFVRGAHYPHHPAFAAACDRLGLLFWSENCFWGKGGFGPEGYWNASAYPVNADDFEPFEAHARQTLTEMIRENRNHPSIIAWSMTNEAFFTYNLDRAKSLMADLVNLSRQLDATRPAAIGGAQRGDIDKLGDIAGYNGDGARLFINPGIPNLVSEYGAISKSPDAYKPFFGEKQTEHFPWRAGEAIWCAFDYGSIAGKQGLKGILDHFRLPKQSWHWYRDHYTSPSPGTRGEGWGEGLPSKLHLSAEKTTINGTDATDDCQIIVTILDAAGKRTRHSPSVTLTILSGPGEFPTGPSITFAEGTDIQITHGQAAIAFRSYHGGQTIIRATSSGLSDATITITTIGEPRFIQGQTPPARARPYTPPPQSQAALVAMTNVVNVALNRPSRASSEATGHPARFANDGDAASFWSGGDDSADTWWQVDLEGFYQLSGSKVIFPASGNWRYVIETSSDGATWTSAIDRKTTDRTDAVRNDIFPPGTIARYIRVTFAALPGGTAAVICEFEVYGVLSVR